MYLYKLYRIDNGAFAGNVQNSMNPAQYAADLAGSEFRAVADGMLADPVTAVVSQGAPAPRSNPTYQTVLGGIFGGGGSVPEPNDLLRQGVPGAVDAGSGGQVSWMTIALVGLGLWLLVGGHK